MYALQSKLSPAAASTRQQCRGARRLTPGQSGSSAEWRRTWPVIKREQERKKEGRKKERGGGV